MKKFLLLIIPLFFLLNSCGDNSSSKNPCEGVSCSNHGKCDASSGRPVCECDEGFHPTGQLECVENEDACKDVKCEDWEECINGDCRLVSGKCNEDKDCNNGKCDKKTHTCKEFNPCDGVDCSNHGKCESDGYGYNATAKCVCDDGFHAVDLNCEKNSVSNPCDGVTCSNHGKCEVKNNSPVCNCDEGYHSESLTCIEDVDPCKDVKCEDFEQCVDGNCELLDGRCRKTSDCKNNKICDDLTNKCEEDKCKDVNCENNGVCTVSNGKAKCNCPHGFKDVSLKCVKNSNIPGWCGIKWPDKNHPIKAKTKDLPTRVYGQIWIDGVTNLNQQPLPNIKASLGYIEHGKLSYPIVPDRIKWIKASFNKKCSACGNNHEYMADFPTDNAGTFDYIFRFSIDDGESWSYCDATPDFITSSKMTPGYAEIKENTGLCGNEECNPWETCSNDTCIAKSGKCNIASDCKSDEICNLETHDCEIPSSPTLVLFSKPVITSDSYSFKVKYVGSKNNLDFSNSKIFLNGEDVTSEIKLTYDKTSKTFTISKTSLPEDKYSYLFRMKDVKGNDLNELFVPMWVEKNKFSWKDAFLYQIMTDRFVNGDSSNDNPTPGVDFKANWQGGDFKGIIEKLDSGYFQNLGVNAIWISSPIINTQGKGLGMNDGKYYSGYHSYWPIGTTWTDKNHLAGLSTPIEPHFGTAKELLELINKAHKQHIRIIVDLVGNHVHKDAPIWAEHKNDNWFHNADDPYVCGWDKPITCWFTDYLPDLNYSNPAVMDAVMNHAVWLAQTFNIDGFRLDAVKHMIVDFSKEIRARINSEVSTTGIPFYMVGETFVGYDEYSTIGFYLGKDKLDGQFDFPLYWRITDVFLKTQNSLKDFYGFVKYNNTRYQKDYFSNAIMSHFFGNHDVVRALTVAANDYGDNNPWGNPPKTPTNEEPFKKLMMAQTFLLTSPQIPLIYQGDEFGMPGIADPDNRRMMIFGSKLSNYQKETLQHLEKLGKFRKTSDCLKFGTYSKIYADDNYLAYSMNFKSKSVIVVFNRNSTSQNKILDISSTGLSGKLTELFSGSTISIVNGKISPTLDEMSSAVFYKK